MNGKTVKVKLALDTNAIIDFLKEEAGAFDLMDLIEQHECFVSVITKLELLKYPDISVEEEMLILDFLPLVPIMPLTDDIERETIAISRASKLKLPDAIIGATAIVYGAEVVTADTHFLECTYPALRIWKLA
jgi:predicted nucleic acid-binding protein